MNHLKTDALITMINSRKLYSKKLFPGNTDTDELTITTFNVLGFGGDLSAAYFWSSKGKNLQPETRFDSTEAVDYPDFSPRLIWHDRL